MEVTGQTKIEFEKWFEENLYAINIGSANLYPLVIADVWKTLPDSFRYGVFVDFFDSVGIDLDVCRYKGRKKFSTCVDLADSNTWTETRPEGRIIAVTEADEIRNKQLDETQS